MNQTTAVLLLSLLSFNSLAETTEVQVIQDTSSTLLADTCTTDGVIIYKLKLPASKITTVHSSGFIRVRLMRDAPDSMDVYLATNQFSDGAIYFDATVSEASAPKYMIDVVYIMKVGPAHRFYRGKLSSVPSTEQCLTIHSSRTPIATRLVSA